MTTAQEALDQARTMGQVMDAFWLCRSAQEAREFVAYYAQRTPYTAHYAEQNIRYGISMEGYAILQAIGKAWLGGVASTADEVNPHPNAVTLDLEDHGQFYTVDNFWDCECEGDYIKARPNSRCSKCGACAVDQPSSRLTEVLERFGLPYEACRFRMVKFVPIDEVRTRCEDYKAALTPATPTTPETHSPGVVNEEDGA